jgi:guanylate cyclase
MEKFIKSLVAYFGDAIIAPNETDDVQLGKRIFVRVHLFTLFGGLFGILQGLVGGSEGVVAIMATFGTLLPINLVFLRRTKLFSVHLSISVILLMVMAVSYGVINGGYVNNFGLYAMLLVPLMLIILVFQQRRTVQWLIALLGLMVLFSFLDPFVNNPAIVSGASIFDNTYTFVITAIIVFLTINYYKRAKNEALDLLEIERERSESLLLNILPKKIADTLKVEKGTIVDQYDSASILFADLVGFTPMSVQLTPTEMIELLNSIYSHFDSLADKYGVEKIRTIGDNYMAASGVPSSRPDHAQALAYMALDMLEFSNILPTQNGTSIDFRIGINSGPLVAGVIGKKKFHYDVWGDTVNTASRMESQGLPGKIQITTHTHEILEAGFLCEKRGILEIKGKGEMETWLLVGRA